MIANTTRKLARPVVAAARELVCFCWAAATTDQRLPTASRSVSRGAGPQAAGTRDTSMSNPVPDEVRLDPRQRSPATRTTGPWVPARIIRLATPTPRPRPGPPTTPPPGRHADGDHPRPLDNPSAISEVAPRTSAHRRHPCRAPQARDRRGAGACALRGNQASDDHVSGHRSQGRRRPARGSRARSGSGISAPRSRWAAVQTVLGERDAPRAERRRTPCGLRLPRWDRADPGTSPTPPVV